jgi:hypothetical protein
MTTSSNNNHNNGSISTSNIDVTLLQYDETHIASGNIFEHRLDCSIFNRYSLHKRNAIYIYICIFNFKMMNHMSIITHDVLFYHNDLWSIDGCLCSISVNC